MSTVRTTREPDVDVQDVEQPVVGCEEEWEAREEYVTWFGTFRPIKIKGEPLSATIIRDRS